MVITISLVMTKLSLARPPTGLFLPQHLQPVGAALQVPKAEPQEAAQVPVRPLQQ